MIEIVLGLTSILLIVLGIIIRIGKGSFLIAGYNTMSKEEKSKYYIDLNKINKMIGNFLFINSLVLIILYLRVKKDLLYLIIIFLLIVILSSVCVVIVLNTRYIKKRTYKKFFFDNQIFLTDI